MLGLHKASFIVWVGAMAIHVLAYARRAARDGFADLGRHRLGGAGLRASLLIGSLAAGAVIALLTLPLAAPWAQWAATRIYHQQDSSLYDGRIRRPLTLARHLDARVRALRATAATLLQTGVAAGLAWYLAHGARPRRPAFFAPVAAVDALASGPDNHPAGGRDGRGRRRRDRGRRRALISGIGRGRGQGPLVVLIAISGAILLGGGALVVSQAASSAVLVATVVAPSHGLVPTRFVDALVGGAVGLAVLASSLPEPGANGASCERPRPCSPSSQRCWRTWPPRSKARDTSSNQAHSERARRLDGMRHESSPGPRACRRDGSHRTLAVARARTDRPRRHRNAAPRLRGPATPRSSSWRAPGCGRWSSSPRVPAGLVASVRHLAVDRPPARTTPLRVPRAESGARASARLGAVEDASPRMRLRD